MGKIDIRFNWEGVPTNAEGKFDNWQHDNVRIGVEYNARVDLLRQCQVAGPDVIIDIDLSKYQDGNVDWPSILPDERSKDVLKDVERYRQLSRKLETLIRNIEHVRFEDKYELDLMGREAAQLIKAFVPSKHFVDWHSHIRAVADLNHTLNKEVKMLDYYKQKDSKRKKDSAINDAVKHLRSDIISFKHSLDHLTLKKDPL